MNNATPMPSDGNSADSVRRAVSQHTQHLPRTLAANDPTRITALLQQAAKAALKTTFKLAPPPTTGNPHHDALLQHAAKGAARTAAEAIPHVLRQAATIIESAGIAASLAHNAVIHNSFRQLTDQPGSRPLTQAAGAHANRTATLLALATNAESILERIPLAEIPTTPDL